MTYYDCVIAETNGHMVPTDLES